MNSSLLVLYMAGTALAVFGLVLMVSSIVPAWRRGQPVFRTFWAPPAFFRGRELLYNRVGFAFSVVGIAMAAFVFFRLRG